MKKYTLEIQNESVAEKVLWMLKHFQDEGISIKENNTNNDDELKNSLKQSVREINQIKQEKLEAKPIEDLLNAL